MFFRSGYDLEDAVFGRHSSGDKLIKKFKGQRPNFDEDVKRLIREGRGSYPETAIGKSFWFEVNRELGRLGVNSHELVFLSAIDTKVDLRHFADGVFFLPSIPRFPITIDAFNIDLVLLFHLKSLWVDSFGGSVYTLLDFQSDLFRYKAGLSKWKKDCQRLSETNLIISQPPDFRTYVNYGRPENHFILTPYDIGTYRRRRIFAKMLARYLVSKTPHRVPEMAQQSHREPDLC